MPDGVTKQTFESADTDLKLNILFDYLVKTQESIKELKTENTDIENRYSTQWYSCDARFKKLEKNWYKVAGVILFLAFVAPFLSTLLLKYMV